MYNAIANITIILSLRLTKLGVREVCGYQHEA